MRKLRIASVQAPVGKYTEPLNRQSNIKWTIETIRKIDKYNVDIVCLSEAFEMVGLDFKPSEYAESVPGSITKRFAVLAKELAINIICPVFEKNDDHLYNSAIVIGKTGAIVGKYHKAHPIDLEIEEGVLPGKIEPTIVDLDGIKIGCQICFDANWPSDWINLKRAGAQIIFFCSAFSAGDLLGSYANILRVPIVAATHCNHCRIYDRMGRIIAHQSPYYDYAICDVLIDQPLFHLDNQLELVEEIRQNYPELSVEIHNGQGTWTITGINDAQKLQEIIDKYSIIDIDQYIIKSQIKQDQVRI